MALLRSRYAVWANPADRTMTATELRVASDIYAPEILLVMAMDRIDAATIATLPASVRVIGTYSVGHDHIDLQAAKARGLAVLSTPDVLSIAVADTAMLLILGAARRAHEGATLIYSGKWTGWTPTQLLGRDVSGARIGILGMGRIGRAIARKAAHGFDMKVHYHNRSRLPSAQEDGATYHASATELLPHSDFLALAAPSTVQTKGFLNEQTIDCLPRDAVVVNIARGDLIDDRALIAALRSGRIAAAGLDVFNNEPDLDPDYLMLPNVFLQPHQGSSTLGTRMRMAELLLDSIDACLAGKVCPNRLV